MTMLSLSMQYFFFIDLFFHSQFQDEKNQILTTNAWLNLVCKWIKRSTPKKNHSVLQMKFQWRFFSLMEAVIIIATSFLLRPLNSHFYQFRSILFDKLCSSFFFYFQRIEFRIFSLFFSIVAHFFGFVRKCSFPIEWCKLNVLNTCHSLHTIHLHMRFFQRKKIATREKKSPFTMKINYIWVFGASAKCRACIDHFKLGLAQAIWIWTKKKQFSLACHCLMSCLWDWANFKFDYYNLFA